MLTKIRNGFRSRTHWSAGREQTAVQDGESQIVDHYESLNSGEREPAEKIVLTNYDSNKVLNKSRPETQQIDSVNRETTTIVNTAAVVANDGPVVHDEKSQQEIREIMTQADAIQRYF